MDQEIYNKIPYGGTWWNYKYSVATSYIQTSDKIMKQPRFNARHIIKNEPLTKDIKNIDKLVQEPPSIQKPVPLSEHKTELTIEKVKETTIKEYEQKIPINGNLDSYEVWKYVIMKIDEASSMYPHSMKDIVEKTVKTRLIDIVSSGDGQIFFGARKTRSIVAWLSGNNITESSEPIIAYFLSWLLSEAIVHEKGVKNATEKYEWILIKKQGYRRQIVWELKNEISDIKK